MGLSIYYNGKFSPKASLHDLIEEVKEIAMVHQWKHHIFEETFPDPSFADKNYDDNIYGICFSPPECEPVWFTFLSNGKMSNPVSLEIYGKLPTEKEKEFLTGNFTKTQFAGEEIHKMVCEIIRYISKKYFKNFKLTDEGGYWETKDEQLLHKNFENHTSLINNFSAAFSTTPKLESETVEEYILRSAKTIQSKLKK